MQTYTFIKWNEKFMIKEKNKNKKNKQILMVLGVM